MRRVTPLVLAAFLAIAPATAVLAASQAAAASAAPCKKGSGPHLRGKDFTDGTPLPSDLRCADLTRAKLDEVDLTRTDLTGAVLRDASLKEADLTQVHVEYADLRGADLSEADLGQLRAKQADFRGAVLIDAEAGQAEFPHADLTEAVLTRTVLTQADLTDATLKAADLRGAELGQVRARTADFTGARLRDATFDQAELQYAVFKDADLTKSSFTQANLQGADLRGADVEDASFTQADDLNLTGARGSAEDVPDDAIVPDGAGNPITGVLGGSGQGPSTAVVLIVLSTLGLGATLMIWGAAHRHRRRSAAAYAAARRAAEEDVTRFGEEIDALDFDMKINQLNGPNGEWQAALDAYEAAKRSLLIAQTLQELDGAAAAVRHGRQALEAVRRRLSDVHRQG
ncbi:pentapeptide repeat-containing protein [Planotetraspora kaengkrachanensis]|uniref:Pentapeptide repeat-containing protein n=1 Tax=Planotetraspora kaengkrachanensis TaxID=575193 RepID=A0A8J3PWD4_9ACTN|nr:pentapeptide repeat-containing protein [Planotetraspora kaengkrachanensis]GIG82305.1 hypothetical protein Pka01_54320 [Planotetraspora kaengkrachanensis]